MSEERGRRKVRQGVVVSAANDKTIVVQVKERKPHRVYKKMMTSTKKFHAHDEGNIAVRSAAGRPLCHCHRSVEDGQPDHGDGLSGP